jgi:two-component system, OmpR family, sensor histidine kinase KdpD
VNTRFLERTFWLLLAVAATAVLVRFRESINASHVTLTYLLIILGVSARGGRTLGLGLALLLFLAFNYLFITPYYTFAIHHRLDYFVLLAFLAASTVATQLLHRARAEASTARARAREIDRLAAVGAEALNAPRATDAVDAVGHVIRAGLHMAAAEIYLVDASAGGFRRIARCVGDDAERTHEIEPDPLLGSALDRAAAGLAIGETGDGTCYVAGSMEALPAGELAFGPDTRALLIPLRAHDRTIGVLRLEDARGIRLDNPQQRFAEALAYYAALALDRVNLAASAEHAEALREADALKDALLASVSHDLRTPLTTIKALAHDLAADGDERAVIIEEEADRLNRFVSDLLDLSRLNAGIQRHNLELVAAEDVLGAALQRVSGSTAGRTINASIEAGEPLLVGRFDFVSTLRALVNLIENAIKYSPHDGSIDVSVRRDVEWIAFEVADRGPGIQPHDVDRIFEPFVRGGASEESDGAGLGLAIARQSIEAQGGQLTCSLRHGGGSIFTARLPLATAADLERMSL